MIVGTAGHIDHGKTTLVRALTGVDTDRLPQEKARGISIELGYAFLDVPGDDAVPRIGFIDVPGHERLVHTMLAGATGIDFALLLVAADDGVMPQTREHLAVLSLLGLSRAAVVITKCDRVDATRLAQVRDEVAALLAGTPLAEAPVLAVAAPTGEGLPALRELLFAAARETPPRDGASDAFRLAIDRAFTLDGVGTVVTGTVHAGRVQVGDELALCPSPTGRHARVRSLHTQNQAATQAHAGQRCAVALAGVDKHEVARGQWLVSAGAGVATDRLDALLTLWNGEPRPLRSGTPVHVHLGASDTMGTVAVLAGVDAAADTLAPGGRAFVQIVLHAPIGAWRGDRIVLRDNSATRTIAGGTVLDPFAPVRYRRTPQRLAELAAWSLPTEAQRFDALLDAAPHGLSRRRWASAEGLAPQAEADAPDGALGGAQRAAVHSAVIDTLRSFHARDPEVPGPDAARLRRLAAPRLPPPLWSAVLAELQADGAVTVRGAFVHLPEHALRLSAADERIAQKVAPLLAAASFDGSWVRDLARDTREGEVLMRTTLARLAQRGELHQVAKDLYYAPAVMAQLAAHARSVAANAPDGAVTATRFRDATALGRKRAIQILEYFDRIGLLRRVGDEHRLRSDTELFRSPAMR
ncbi:MULTISPECIES: selenocysteine-specific translation elongation factor [unclassified Rhizobacter]|uniref:selenocysteine-specific translation elongation factor n=1 Tax=unclassified Rhizobacter TaxID=2640088 RepID=UPI0006FCEC94|nr:MULTISPECIES: selenocysteine-specific translation elongation factor [unclassified Rhizobacter]KQU74263.1 selenocysteine-specific elongation factor [Rhizobacter sp. Root29]KQW03276.1 selenocysteine-specific elongation factor [Rhizobacter sp. Root1238]KRB14021.1 selenocysteine-specific elongation factor [Rhizobacter sp. Root16D2]